MDFTTQQAFDSGAMVPYECAPNRLQNDLWVGFRFVNGKHKYGFNANSRKDKTNGRTKAR